MVKQKNVELGLRIRKAVNYIIYVENLSNIGEVADIIERDKSNLSKALNGDTQYANVYIDAICKKYSIIDRNWLLGGEGKMILSDNNNNSGQNFGSIGGNNKSSYTNVGNHINVSLPENGTHKIIKPDGSVEIQSLSSSVGTGLNDTDRLNQRIQDLERIILEKDATIKSKDETIWALRTMLDRQ